VWWNIGAAPYYHVSPLACPPATAGDRTVNRLRQLALVALLAPFALQGQASPDPTMTSFRFISARFSGYLTAAFDSIPADRYAYSPTAQQQTIGYIAQHLEDANYSLCDRFGAMKHATRPILALPDAGRATWPKDSLTARLRASFAFCDAAMRQLHDSSLATRVAYGPPGSALTALPSRSLLLFVTDLAEHYSQVASYMRTMGLVPPTALPPRVRTAIEVPASALAGYAGTYDLPPSTLQDAPALVLVVTVQDGAVYMKPGARPAARLWPESSTEFFVKEVDAQVTFVKDASGAVTGLVVHQNGEDRPAAKVR
jgi:uncharacterized damage-inducible protein DinB